MKKYAILFGAGCGKPGYELRLPMAIVGLITSAEDIRQKLPNNPKGAILIADLFAENEAATVRHETIKRILSRLGIADCWDIISQKDITGPVPALSHIPSTALFQYMEQEAKDIEMLLENSGTKIGWSIKGNPHGGGEVMFDEYIRKQFPAAGYTFMYTQPATKFDGMRGAPYCTQYPDRHILIPLTRSEHINNQQKLPKHINLECFQLLSGYADILRFQTPAHFFPVLKNRGKLMSDGFELGQLATNINYALNFLF